MSLILAAASPGENRVRPLIRLTGLFWVFSYALLTLRGAILFDDWTRLIEGDRLLAVSFGAIAYGLALSSFETARQVSLWKTMGWIVAATVAVMTVRLVLDQGATGAHHGLALNVLWSLTWSTYFAVWVLGAMIFEPAIRASVAPAAAAPAAVTRATAGEPTIEAFETIIGAILDDASILNIADREELANRVIALGGYEVIGVASTAERARLAARLAARISLGR
jgi:hypothetical protein